MTSTDQLFVVLTIGEASALLARFGARDPAAELPALAKIRAALVGAAHQKKRPAKATIDGEGLRTHDTRARYAAEVTPPCDAIDPQAQRPVRPGPRVNTSSSSSSSPLQDYTPYRDEAGGIYR